jgi:hypothetical protein
VLICRLGLETAEESRSGDVSMIEAKIIEKILEVLIDERIANREQGKTES